MKKTGLPRPISAIVKTLVSCVCLLALASPRTSAARTDATARMTQPQLCPPSMALT